MDGRRILLASDTDVSLLGHLSREWLLITPDRVLVVEDGKVPKVLQCLFIEDIESIRVLAGVGSGTLQAKVDGDWIDMLRYTNSLSQRFHKISRAIERSLEEAKESGSRAIRDVWHYLSSSSDQHVEPLDPPRCPKCALLLAHREETCPRCLPKGQILRRVGALLYPHWRSSLLLCLIMVLGVAAELIPPKLQQYMVDHVLATSHQVIDHATDSVLNSPAVLQDRRSQPEFATALLVVVLALAGSRIILSIVGVLKGQLATAIGTGITSTLRAEMVQKLQSLAIAYYDRHQIGSMLSRVAHDSEALHGLIHQITGGFLLQIVQLIGVGAMLVWLNAELAMYTLIPVPLVFLGSWIFWQKVYPKYYRLWDASSKQMSVLNGMLSGIRVVKAFAQEPREFSKFQNSSEQLRQWRLWVEHTNAWYSASMSLVFSLGGLIVWYIGGRDVIGGEMTLGELIAFLAYLAMFYAPLSGLTSFTSWLTSFLSGSKRVLELLDTPAAIMASTKPIPWEDPRGEIEFDKVSFGYDRNQPVLKDVSFRVQAGEMVGIVGRSGSGKTTLVNLLGRFYDVQEGRILVDGVDIRDLSMEDLRKSVGIVFQDSFLFRGTIWKNLSYGRPETSIEEGLLAAKAAGAHDFICRQPLGYETLLGEHGAGLSGGEKQRLSIARTLLYDPRILVLDEATSNTDAEAEKSIQEALEVLIQGRTTIAIAHRLSTLRNADRILVFDRGSLIEEGTHAELLQRDGTYSRLVKIQTQVSKDPSVDRLLHGFDSLSKPRIEHLGGDSSCTSATATLENGSYENRAPDTLAERPRPDVCWMNPSDYEFRCGKYGQMEVWSHGQCRSSNAFVVRTFPASHPSKFLSIREWSAEGEEKEIGVVRSLLDWSQAAVQPLLESLGKRYLLRTIHRVLASELRHGFLELEVETDIGPRPLTMRWTQSQAVDFGESGKMLIDIEENRFIVPNVDKLSPADRERFLRYVYW